MGLLISITEFHGPLISPSNIPTMTTSCDDLRKNKKLVKIQQNCLKMIWWFFLQLTLCHLTKCDDMVNASLSDCRPCFSAFGFFPCICLYSFYLSSFCCLFPLRFPARWSLIFFASKEVGGEADGKHDSVGHELRDPPYQNETPKSFIWFIQLNKNVIQNQRDHWTRLTC